MGYFEEFIGVDLWTALFTLLNTLTVIFVGKKFLFKPVMKMIQDRQKEIDDLYSDANAAKSQANALESEYRQKLSTAQATSEKMLQEASARAQAHEEDILRQANAEAAAMKERANAEIALEKKKAINDAKNEISDLALTIAGKVVERELSRQDQADLIDRFINEIG